MTIGPRAAADITGIAHWLRVAAGAATAERYVRRIRDAAYKLDLASERGIDRSDISPGLRVVAFEKSGVFAIRVYDAEVTVLRFFYRGRNWEAALKRGEID